MAALEEEVLYGHLLIAGVSALWDRAMTGEVAEKVIVIRSLQVAAAAVPVLLALTAPVVRAVMEELAYTTVPSSAPV